MDDKILFPIEPLGKRQGGFCSFIGSGKDVGGTATRADMVTRGIGMSEELFGVFIFEFIEMGGDAVGEREEDMHFLILKIRNDGTWTTWIFPQIPPKPYRK
jgi:hypothetical protein